MSSPCIRLNGIQLECLATSGVDNGTQLAKLNTGALKLLLMDTRGGRTGVRLPAVYTYGSFGVAGGILGGVTTSYRQTLP